MEQQLKLQIKSRMNSYVHPACCYVDLFLSFGTEKPIEVFMKLV